MSDTPTPRTDEKERAVSGLFKSAQIYELLKHARALECELAAEREEITRWKNVVRQVGEAIGPDTRGKEVCEFIVELRQRAEQAEAKLAIAREALHIVHCDISALKREWVSQQPDGFKMVAANIEKLSREALDKIK